MAEEGENGNGGFDELRAFISNPRGGVFLPTVQSDNSYDQILNETFTDPMMTTTTTNVMNLNRNVELLSVVSDGSLMGDSFNQNGGRNGRSIAERRAARCGFDASRINTARFRSVSPLSSPSMNSSYLSIPPGLSPTSLLDSPVMLSNSQGQSSPTTGSFALATQGHGSTCSVLATTNIEKDKGEDVDSSFMFKPHGNPVHLQGFSAAEAQALGVEMATVNHQSFSPLQPQLEYDSQDGFRKQTEPKNCATSSLYNIEVSNNMTGNSKCLPLRTSQSGITTDRATQPGEQVLREDVGSKHLSKGNQKGAYPASGMGRPQEDGYNWRKYGQKQVKGSEFPRSYYKCTYPDCNVKKKVECSLDGHITEIIYEGDHDHAQPQPNRRSSLGSAYLVNEMSDTSEVTVKVEGEPAWRSRLHGSKDNNVGPDWKTNGPERTSSTSLVTELSDQLSTAQEKHLGILESADTPELSSTLASHDDDEDRATQGSISLGDDADDGESESKRRKRESSVVETNIASRSGREPKVVVQTPTEVDVLEDGYRWRKYGQKVVKGNPNPRSYYKCTAAGCNVRKHVERASKDRQFVITTYEGKHNHEVPAARNSSHGNSSNGNGNSNNQNSVSLPRITIPKPEPQLHDLVPHFDSKPNLTNEFFRPGNLGSFATDMKFTPSSCYDMKFQPFQTVIPCGSFGLNPNINEVHQPPSIPQSIPDFPIPLPPMNFPLSPNLEFNSFNFNNHGKTVIPVQPFLGIQQPKEEYFGPKQEQKDDSGFESTNHLGDSSPSTMCSRFMGGGF